MNKAGIGFEINLRENGKIKSIPMTKEAGEKLKKQFGKPPSDYIKEIIGEKLYNQFNTEFTKAQNESIPKDLVCDFCNKLSSNKDDKACNKYHLQMNMTYYVSTLFFVDLVNQNRHIFQDNESLKKLTGRFLSNFHFYKGLGVLWFDSYNFHRNMLEEGFGVLSLMFKKMPVNEAIRTINDTKEDIELRQTLDALYKRTDPHFLTLQRRFFNEKLRYYEIEKNVQLFEKKTIIKSNNEQRPYSMDVALAIYYRDELNNKMKLGNLTSLKAWEQIALETNKNKDNLRKAYSKIIKTNNRVTAERVENLKYVASNMLNDYPIGKAKAIEELELAIRK